MPRLSEACAAVLPLLGELGDGEAEVALRRLPENLRAQLAAMSPETYVHDIHASLIVLLHDRQDPVIPVSESRHLRDAFDGRAGVHYTEFTVFRHLDPTKGKPRPLSLARELLRFGRAVHPLFRQVAA